MECLKGITKQSWKGHEVWHWKVKHVHTCGHKQLYNYLYD